MGAFTLENIPDAVAACLPPSPQVEWPVQGMTSDVMIASGGGRSVVIKRCTNPIYLEEAQENLAWCDGTAELLEELRPTQPAPTPEVLIHGDTALDNVLIDDAGNLSLIDWATADSGDARCDIALALQTEPETTFAEEEVRAFYVGYAGPRVDRVTRKWFEDLWDFF